MKASVVFCLAFLVAIVIAACDNNCNSHGTCSQGACVCTTGWSGDDCSIWDKEIQSGETKTGHLATFQWKYYHLALPNGANGIVIQVNQTSDFGDIDLFVGRNYFPNTDNFDYQDTSTGSHLVINVNPAASGTWYIGLYGYWSADFQIKVEAQYACTVDCGEHGFCNGHVCACYDPYTSEDCSIYDQTITSGQSIDNSVETGDWKYFNMDIIDGDSLSLTLTQDSNNYDLDVYIAADRYPVARNFDYLNATTVSTTTMHLTNLQSGHYEIGIFGYRGGHFTLLVTVEHATADCENDCSVHGYCVSGTCSCYSAYGGNYCETYQPDMELNTDYTGFVESGKWNYWHLHYFTQSPVRINVAQTSSGDCDLYVKQGSLPTRIVYQFADLTLNSEFSVTIQNPGDETWFIGVYGWTGCSFEINAEVVDDCQCTAESHGHCKQDSTQCFCDIGYAGETCTTPSLPISSGQVLSLQFADTHQWNYYRFTTDASGVSITAVETSTVGEIFLAVNLAGYPSGENFEYYDISESDFHEIHIVWHTERTPRTYYIGVLKSSASVATDQIEYSITAYGTPF